ncbi:MAG: DUF1501 domain-containing protein [Planctomycetaceae bacterium]
MRQPIGEFDRLTRRHFLTSQSLNLGAVALAGLTATGATSKSVLGDDAIARDSLGGIAGLQTIAPKARRVIYLFQSGGPSQADLFDYKPAIKDRFGEDLPESVRAGQRLTGFTNGQKRLPVVPTKFKFAQHGASGAWMSELLPHTAKVVDHICFLKAVHSEAINHDPARMLIQTGSQLAGRPSMGSWLAYGLGCETQELPAFLVLNSYGSCKRTPQPVSIRLWGSGFLPSQYQGVKLQSTGDPILYVSNPGGIDRSMQRDSVEAIASLNRINAATYGDPETEARIKQYEMAFRMQASVPELLDISGETRATIDLYGEDSLTRGSYAANCLLARRMAERGVRFIQLYHVGWDHHEDVPRDLALQCQDTDRADGGTADRPRTARIARRDPRRLGGEFGRTIFSQGEPKPGAYGRDHHGRCFTMWMAGGGIKGGMTWGSSDDYSYSVAENGVHVHDLQATILHLLGIDHTRLTYQFQGREFRLTDVHGEVVGAALA